MRPAKPAHGGGVYTRVHAHKRWHQRFRHSLRWRLVALFLLLAVGTVVVFVGGTRAALTGGFQMLVKPLLADYVDRLAAEVGSPPDVARAQALVARLPISIRIDGPRVHWDSHPARTATREPQGGERDMAALLTRTTADGHQLRFGLGDVVWHARHPWPGVVPLAGLLLLTLAAYATVRRLFRPLDDIRAGALRYGEGDFSRPIPVRRRDELGDLASQVNDMASGLRGMLDHQRALLLAISHELRSPLTRARLNAELSAESPERVALLRDLTLMGELITDLLEGERLAAGPAALKREPTDLNTLVREVVATGCAGQPVQLSLADDLPPLMLDRPRASMLVRNLVDNACRHGAAAGQPVTVSTHAEAAQVVLTVRDHGPGVPPEQLSRLAEPFYRPDVARTRAGGGVGLGLYLCRLVAQSHGGTLVLRNAAPGLEASVRWPV
ncbi:MAG: HAMP domain-containing histidine kinase [Rhizobacter sp.]|nr:HAMP domain-containing histidine kinase [Rhizobacter sp.]